MLPAYPVGLLLKYKLGLEQVVPKGKPASEQKKHRICCVILCRSGIIRLGT